METLGRKVTGKQKNSSLGPKCFLTAFLDLWMVRARGIIKMLTEMLGQVLSKAMMPSKKTEDTPR